MSNAKKQVAIRCAIVGMGGFAGRHHGMVVELEKTGESRLICTSGRDPSVYAEKMKEWRFEERGVAVFNDYREMLVQCRDRLDMVIVSTPIPLHAEMHRFCVDLGLPVYLEKPPTLDPEELEEMIQCDERQAFKTHIPFNFIVERPRRQLKKRLLDGEFGRLETVTFCGVAPRASTYYTRANWSGQLMLGESLVLDSCMGNAMAHKVHDALFWAGTGELFSWAPPSVVKAELYRAHSIKGTDTVFCSAETGEGARLRLFLTHAWMGNGENEETIQCEKATIRYATTSRISIQWKDGRTEEVPLDGRQFQMEHHRWYHGYLRGERDRPLTTLEDCRPMVHLNNLIYLSSDGITEVKGDDVERISAAPAPGEFFRIRDVVAIGRRFLAEGQFPSEQGIPWARASVGVATPADLPRLRQVIEELSEKG
jgi:predicted dehydrogenase